MKNEAGWAGMRKRVKSEKRERRWSVEVWTRREWRQARRGVRWGRQSAGGKEKVSR